MTRRAVLTMAASVVALADERTEVLELISQLASALSNGDAEEFLSRIPADSPNRDQLADNIRTLLAQAEMTCSIQLRSLEQGRAQLDWYMQIRSRSTQSMLERRKQIVTAIIREGKVFSLQPVDFFRPATVR